MTYDKLSKEQKAVLLILYDRELNKPSGFKAFMKRRDTTKNTLQEILPNRSNKEYKNLLKEVQDLEDQGYLIAGEKMGRDEPYWAEQTKLRLEAKGREFIRAHINDIRSDKAVKKYIETIGAKLFSKAFIKAAEETEEAFEERDDDAWQIAMGQDEYGDHD